MTALNLSNQHRSAPDPRQRISVVQAFRPDHIEKLVAALGGLTELRLALGLSPAELNKVLATNPGLPQVAITSEGKVAGYLMIRWNLSSSAYIQNVSVLERHRRHGLALSMINESVAAARRQVAESKISAAVLSGNTPAQNLFIKAGFIEKPRGRRDMRLYTTT